MVALACVDPDAEVIDLPNEESVDVALMEALLGEALPASPFKRARGLCRECQTPKNERRSLAEFCSDKCRSDFHNRSKVQGAQIISVAKRWRRYRRSGDLSLLCKLLGDFVREDKAAGRNYYPDPPLAAYTKVVGKAVQGRRRQRS